MKLIHISDIHLDHLQVCNKEQIKCFGDFLNKSEGEVILCTGDNSNARDGIEHLTILKGSLNKPFYFVHGNHDYYCGSIPSHKRRTAELFNSKSEGTPFVFLTGEVNPVLFNEGTTAVIGHDGWYDGRAGDWRQIIFMADFQYIEELAQHRYISDMRGDKVGLWKEIQNLSRESIDAIDIRISNIVANHKQVKNIIIATHVPPWRESSLFAGKPNNPAWAPGFVHYQLGRYLEIVARENPDINFTVFCGHSHHQATFQVEPNLVCETAFAEYKHPDWSYGVYNV